MDIRHAPAEVDIDPDLALDLLREQHPHLLPRALTLVGEGWDNVTYRLGSEYAIRIPRRKIAVDLLLAEQKWLPVIAPLLPVAVPVPVETGVPSDRFRWPWSVVEWIPGETADLSPLAADQASVIANILLALHQPAPKDAPTNPFRGGPLRERREVVEERLERLTLGDLVPIWERAISAEPSRDRRWIHGDLHARNVLVQDGVLTGIIDWGDMNAGDVATDVACAWTLFESDEGRAAFLGVYAPRAEVLARAAGWAVNLASALLDSGEPRHVEMGRLVRHRLIDWSRLK